MNVVLINNYPMDNAYRLWQEGVSGSHHVWGKVELERNYNYNFILFRHVKYPFLNKVGRLFGVNYLDQQLRLIFWKRRDYVLYLPYASSNSKLLLVLKWLGMFNVPMVSLIHQPFLGTKSDSSLKRAIAKRGLLLQDAVVFLSEALLKDTLQVLGLDKDLIGKKFFVAQWGPDTLFYKKFLSSRRSYESCRFFISAGHTDRDYATLIEAFREIDFPLHIYCTETTVPKVDDLPSNVSIFSKRISYAELLPHYADALAILIPLKFAKEDEGCQGMTSLQDVVALGKPTIITTNLSLNLNVEEEGLGIMVDMFDKEGWVRSVNLLLNDKNLWNKMVYNAGRVYEEKFNSEIFAENLHLVFQQLKERN